MEIYLVQQGDTIKTIAQKYNMTMEKLIQDNGLENPYQIILGQALIISTPSQYYTVEIGDSLQSIADQFQVPLMQLLQNNPNLSGRTQLFPGESLVISYPTIGSIFTNGYAYPHIRKEILLKSLPNLTYLTIFNYSITEGGEIVTYEDDDWMIELCKTYKTIPLMMVSSLSPQGAKNVELAYKILLNTTYQENNINQIYEILKKKGYGGVNLVINFANQENQDLYANFIKKLADRLQNEHILMFITINYASFLTDDKLNMEQIDYSKFSEYASGVYFTELVWGAQSGPPAPIINIPNLQFLIKYVTTIIPAEKTGISIPILGYDWSLPYIPNRTYGNSLTINALLDLAYHVNTIIQFDKNSLTPFYTYSQFNINAPAEHIVWFTDVRSMDALSKLTVFSKLKHCGIWNIMVYDAPLWTIMNSIFQILKVL